MLRFTIYFFRFMKTNNLNIVLGVSLSGDALGKDNRGVRDYTFTGGGRKKTMENIPGKKINIKSC